ncbi:MAG: nucleotide sugar dehydrogenase [Rickettsiales bacterium]|nr:nucleotide sugar dehydrogenase [Rickettsiales bacterium]
MLISIVGGAGRVGLPLAIVLAESKKDIRIVDTDKLRVNSINSKIMPFEEIGAQEILRNLPENRIVASTDIQLIEGSEVCILIIGTPVLEDGKPSTDSLLVLIKEMIPFLRGVKLLILRSTVFPGVTRIIKNYLSTNNLEIEVSYCPERLIEGDAINELKNLPQIVGVETDGAFDLSLGVFGSISSEIIRTTIEEAEIVKLFANTFRYLQFGIANEFFEICVSNNLNWENVWNALKFKYPRAASLPNPGFAAGPCLVKDTQQLNYYYDNNFKLGNSVLEINENLPDFLINKLTELIDIRDKTIGILGMTFKGEIDDFRQSLSFRLKRILETKAKKVYCSDSKLQEPYFVDTQTLIQNSDIIFIATPHHEYRAIVTDKAIIDIWRITKNQSLI